ncbi:GNAT family N-acetyltransferase [Dyadobacter psychrotolerans]|uniref:GNAT family N-acetyltransferase n=1 Tax=Dyadobacter psychrotolerans TaxID=2541721 RepID=A0A4R5DRY4_9BACT|nr:GNAT family N-acetyltransferase [Dyadobacter psychrotolerans]TDE17216.1 GNAT family N-acetyltransferase [Dyadobacter psychrotolerans]
MIELIRTDSQNRDFKNLVKCLDEYLSVTDGSDHSFYSQYNKIDKIKYVIVAVEDSQAVGCGAIKEFDTDTMEVKRMFTNSESRGKGLATTVLTELEKWAAELSYKKCVLETGIRQLQAIALYKKNGYRIIPNYGQYIGVADSVCFEKVLK